jgi:4-alpha-glucanotransferase
MGAADATKLERATLHSRVALAMPSCDGFMGRYILDGQVLGGFGKPLELADVDGLVLDDGVLGGNLCLNASQLVRMRGMPFFTVSQSEAGFEKIMQAVMLTLQWTGSNSELTILLSVNQGNIEF